MKARVYLDILPFPNTWLAGLSFFRAMILMS